MDGDLGATYDDDLSLPRDKMLFEEWVEKRTGRWAEVWEK